MSAGDYLAGLAFFAGTAGSVLVAAAILVERRLGHLDAVGKVLAGAIVGTAGIAGVHLLPGLVGILSRTSALVLALVVLTAATRLPRAQAPPPRRAAEPPPPSGRLSWAIATVAGTVALVAGLAAAWHGIGIPSMEVDTLTFHLPNIANWIQTGSVWRIDSFAPLQPTGHYPQTGDLVTLSTILPWRNDAFVRAIGLPFAAVAGLSVYASAVEVRAPRATGALLGALFVAIPAFAFETYEGAKTDPVMLACFGTGLYFLFRNMRTGLRSDLVLAGLGLGLALGTKWYALTSLAAVLVSWSLVWLLARRPRGELLRSGAVLVGVVALAGGIWMLRNWALSGNPVWPIRVAPLGIELFGAPTDFQRRCAGFAISAYFGSPGIWRHYFWPAYRDMLGLPGLVCVLGWAGAVILLGRAWLRDRAAAASNHAVPLLLTICAGLLAVAYTVTPYTAFGLKGMPSSTASNVRWLMPAMVAVTVLTAWVVGRLPARRRPLAEAAVLIALLQGIRRGFVDPPVAVLGAVAALALAGLAAWLVWRRRSVPLLAGIGMAAAVAVAVVGYNRQRVFNSDRYSNGDAAVAWISRHAPSGHKVGLAGLWDLPGIVPAFPAFGPRLRNDVSYAGPLVESQMRQYHTRSRFLAAVKRNGYDLLVIGKAADLDPAICRLPDAVSDELAWARQAGYRKLAESDRLALYQVRQ